MKIPGGRTLETAVRHHARPAWRAWRRAGELAPVVDRTAQIGAGDIVVFTVARNEAALLPRFLDHHRALGAGHFIIADNGSTDATADIAADAPDCSLFRATGSYRAAHHGVDWLNTLLARFGTGHWCLTLDVDEFLVYPHCDARDLHELTAQLEARGRGSFFTVMLDMYPQGPLGAAHYRPGEDPLTVCPWYDADGYQQVCDERTGGVFISGGVRRRAFFTEEPGLAPALNKVPLVRWKRRYAYLTSTHDLVPRRHNAPHGAGDLETTGCLLHFKLFASILDKAREEMQRRQHWDHGSEYAAYLAGDGGGRVLWNEASRRYAGWRGLVDDGLMNAGAWI